MADISTTQAIAWGWIEYPWPLPSGSFPPHIEASRSRRQELREKVIKEMRAARLQVFGPVRGNFTLRGASAYVPNPPLFEGEFVEMCRFATRYLTEEGNS